MPRRVPIRLVRLLAVACACLVPAAAAHAAAPGNDMPTAATPVTLQWTAQSEFQSLVQASDWGEATTGPEDADPLPSCTGSTGFRSMWYSLQVKEAAVLRVTVVSTDPVRFQPVVNVLSPAQEEVGCGLANDVKQGATANATAYVTPGVDGTPQTYLIRVAEVANNSPSGGLPSLTVRFAAHDVTPPHIRVCTPTRRRRPGCADDLRRARQEPDDGRRLAGRTRRPRVWEFHDKLPDGRDHDDHARGPARQLHVDIPGPARRRLPRRGLRRQRVHVPLLDARAGHRPRPDVKFSLRPPEPGARRLRITVQASESVTCACS